ncbi:MAG: amidohydrolase [Streptosporangiaceae bacterium]
MTTESGSSLLIVNANVLTLDDRQPTSEAVLITDGRVDKVGSSAELRSLAADAEVLDVAGACVLPGFIDGHTHFEMTSVSMDHYINAHTPPCRSLADIADVIRRERDRSPEFPWVVCRSSFGVQHKVAEGRLFTRQELDELVARKPLVVFAGLHVSMLNTAAMAALNLLTGPAPHGVTVHRDDNGEPTGVVTEIFDKLPAWPAELVAAAVAAHESDVLLANGITSILSIPFSGSEMRAVRMAQRRGELTVRVRHYPVHPWGASLDSFEQLGLDSDVGDDRYRFGGVKLFVDGIGSDGLDEIIDDVKYTQEQFNDVVGRADRLGLQVLMHAFTRRGITTAARAAVSASRNARQSERRHRIEHGADYVNIEDLELIRASGVSLVASPHFMYSGAIEIAPPTPLRSLIDAGFRPIGGTDSTGTVLESASPLFNIACAVTRRRKDGSSFQLHEAITPLEGVKMFTTWAAYGSFEEKSKGKLAPGCLGDAIILSADPLSVAAEDLHNIKIDGTIIGGRLVYSD